MGQDQKAGCRTKKVRRRIIWSFVEGLLKSGIRVDQIFSHKECPALLNKKGGIRQRRRGQGQKPENHGEVPIDFRDTLGFHFRLHLV